MNAALARKILGKSTTVRASENEASALSLHDLQELDAASLRAQDDLDTANAILDRGSQRAQRFFAQIAHITHIKDEP